MAHSGNPSTREARDWTSVGGFKHTIQTEDRANMGSFSGRREGRVEREREHRVALWGERREREREEGEGELGGRGGRGGEEEVEEEEDIGGVLPFKGAGYCLPCT